MKPSSVLYGALALGLTDACLLPSERPGAAGRALHKPRSSSSHVDYAIGKGDRFKNGAEAPRGLGVDDRSLGSILNVGEIRSALKGLAAEFDEVELFTAPYTTYQNRSVYGAVVGDKPRVFIQSGIHARERGGPDNVIYFLADLLHARKTGGRVTYGNHTYSNEDVSRALSAGVAIVPMINPDGVAYDQRTDTCWRKNRNPASSSPSDPRSVGIDLNRNYDYLWDYTKAFDPVAAAEDPASDDPSSEVFHGTKPFSEPETRNSAWVMKRHRTLSWFLDLHSFTGDILYGPGDDDAQTTNPAQSFTNRTYDGKRGILGEDDPDNVYGEYISKEDLDAQKSLSGSMTAAMSSAGSIRYGAIQSSHLYPTSGSSTDYAIGGYYGRTCGANRIQGLAIEFGNDSGNVDCPFYPDERQYHESMRQVGAGLMELLLGAASEMGELKTYQCNGNGTSNGNDGSGNGGSSGGSNGNNGNSNNNNGGDSHGGSSNGNGGSDGNDPPGAAASLALPGLTKLAMGVCMGTLGVALFGLL